MSSTADSCPILRLDDVLEKHSHPIMQLLSHYLPHYHMSLLTTKCLNTAVMTMYLALGEGAIETTRQCDVQTVRSRESNSGTWTPTSDMDVAVALRELLGVGGGGGGGGGRQLHYVMLTDGHMPLASEGGPVRVADGENPGVSSSSGTEYFPGHVFVIERTPRGSWRLYQSYINQYTVSQYVNARKRENSRRARDNRGADVAPAELQGHLDGLVEMMSKETWDARTSAFWSGLTWVDAAELRRFEGRRRAGVILLCHRHRDSDACGTHLVELVQRGLRDCEGEGEGRGRGRGEDATWGDATRYDPPGPGVPRPLTNGEMRASLQAILTDISFRGGGFAWGTKSRRGGG